MEAFHKSIAEMQKKEGVRVIERAHMLWFLDASLPKRGERSTHVEGAEPSASG
jgi:hypothetical protein